LSQNQPSSESITASLVKPPAEKVNFYFLDLDRLLARIENATTHYQILGLERDALRDQIDRAFRDAVTMLYPPYQVSATVPAQMLARIEGAFVKITQAFSVLASFARRRDYDTALSSVAVSAPAAAPSAGTPAPAIDIHSTMSPRAAYSESSSGSANDNRRRTERYKVALPVRIVGIERNGGGKWAEMAETLDISRTGVRLRLNRPVRHGMVLYLSLPLPTKLRSHGFTDASYNVYALVRRIDPPKKGARLVGLEFIGEHPPTGYLAKPWATFRLKTWAGNERRRAPRVEHAEAVRIEYISEATHSRVREEVMTENISRAGARVVVRAAPAEFDMLLITIPARQFEGLATLRNRFLGKDGLERLCLQLLDKEWPTEIKRRDRPMGS
jgi:hypothetical protein